MRALQANINAAMPRQTRLKKVFVKNWRLYVMLAPVIVYFLVFHYIPMFGVQLAFKDFIASKGILGSPWVGFKHFERFYHSYYFGRLLKNTLGIGIYEIVVGFPIPIVLALMINEVGRKAFKRFIQTVTYMPHFLSTVVLAGIIFIFLDQDTGIVNVFIKMFGGQPLSFITEPSWFKSIFVLSGVWQHMGWGSIIYLAALSGIDPQLHESARVDGASRMQRIWHINLPGIMPTIVILLILKAGTILSVGFEKVFLLQNDLNLVSSDVISTFVYRSGLLEAQYSFATAIDLFNAVINLIMLLTVNYIAKRAGGSSLW